MSKNMPQYQRYPDLYAYDTEVKKHILKSGILYRKRYALYPSRFIESKSMFPQPIPQVQNININHVKQKESLTQIGQPQYSHPVPVTPQVPQINKQQEADDIRNSIQSIIREELKKNNESYKNKQPEEMSTMFRKLLIEKLSGQMAKPIETMSHKTQQPQYKSITTKSQLPLNSNPTDTKWKFQMANLPSNDNIDDYGDDEYVDENDSVDSYEVKVF